ncbi:protein disulfide-isomerase-like [Primulina huaijiensis]|uniref:protein disulfide-isomerase-like n=1 Tax=Primulina huaijiensis TaxID=1492673 RepID=UPI003CC7009C
MTLAEKLRSDYWGIYFNTDYSIAHTLDAKFLPRGEPVDKPTLRLLKPFDELFVDFQDFKVDAMEKFIKEASIPLVTVRVVLFVNFSKELDSFETKYNDVATLYKEKGVSFQFGDVDAGQGAFQYFGLKEEQAPLLIIQDAEGQKYLKANIEPSQIASWVKDYLDGHVKPFIRSEPIPDVNNEPVKVVVTDSLQDMVFSSGKNVLLEFHAQWCGHCKKLAPILDEVAISFENDPDVVIAKLDATVNDIPSDTFDVQGYPTLYFRSSSGNILPYDGERTKEDIVDFIQKNRDSHADPISTKSEAVDTDSVKDKL